jgi:tetratricopeptide (TPR) repeat protein
VQLGPFELGAPVGEGGMGSVWAGRHRVLDVPVAVKVMSGEMVGQWDFLGFFQREVRALARLAHPNVIWVHDHGLIPDSPAFRAHDLLRPGLPYLVMELCDGTLRDRSRWLTTWDSLRDVLERLLSALGHAHARGVVHCDLKLDNVLVQGVWNRADARPALKLCDFGIVHFRGEAGTALGTPSHMAPEQFAKYGGRQVGPWSDLYALGVLAWSLSTGKRPFDGELPANVLLQRKLARDTGPFLPRIEVPEGLEGWLMALLAPNPEDRFRSAADARAGLRALERTPVHVRPSEEVTLPLDQDLERFRRLRGAVLPSGWRGTSAQVASAGSQGAGLALIGLREIPIVDREAERAALWQALIDVASRGRPVGVLITGEEGVGTTALARWVASRADEEGGIVTVELQGRAAVADVSIALLAALLRLDDLTDPTLARERLRLLGADYGAATDALDLLLAGVDDGDLRRGLVLQVLAAVARQRPVIVVLDALDERKSLRALLGRGLLGDGAVLWVATAHRAPELSTARVDLRRIELTRLPDPSLIRVLSALLPLDEKLSAEIAVRAMGRPRQAVDALRDLAVAGDLEEVKGRWSLRPRADLRRELEVERWLERLDDDVRRAAFLAAVIGRDIPSRAYYRAAGELGVRVAAVQAVEQMTRRGWIEEAVDGWRFRSPAVRQSVLDFARGTLEWFGLHGTAAAALEADGVPLVRVGEVLLAGGDLRKGLRFVVADLGRIRESESRETALSVVRDAQEALEAATVLHEEALHGALWWWEVELLRLLGRAEECREVAMEALDDCQGLDWPDTGARLAVSLADLAGEDAEAAMPWLDQALRLVPENASDPEMRASILERLGDALHRRGHVEDGELAWEEAVRLLELAERPEARASSARLQCALAGLAGDWGAAFALGRVAVERVAAHTPSALVDTLILFGEAALRAGELREGRKALWEAADRSALRGAPSARALVGVAMADVHLGALADAEVHALRALESGASYEWAALAEAVLVVWAARRGRSREVAPAWARLLVRLEGELQPSEDLAELLEMIAVGDGPIAEEAGRLAQRERRRVAMRR